MFSQLGKAAYETFLKKRKKIKPILAQHAGHVFKRVILLIIAALRSFFLLNVLEVGVVVHSLHVIYPVLPTV